jgi:hypothetical protein
MITSILLSFVYAFVWAVTSPIRLLPDVSLSSGISTAITTAGQYITPLNTVIPISTLLTIFGLVIGIEGSIFLYKVIMWIVKRIPTQS